MIYLFPGSFGLPEEPTSPAQPPPIDGNPTVSSAGVMYSTLLQLRACGDKKLERPTLKQLDQRLQKDFALLQPQIELLERPTTSESSSLMTLENKITVLEKHLSTETCRYNSRLNSLQHQLSAMGDQICQFEHSNSNFILWKITSIQLVFLVRQIMVSEARAGKCSKHPPSQPYFSLSPIWLQLLFEIIPLWICSCYRNMGFYLSFQICWRIWWHSALAGLEDNPDESAWPTEPSWYLEPDNWVQRINQTNLSWVLYRTNSSIPLLLSTFETL